MQNDTDMTSSQLFRLTMLPALRCWCLVWGRSQFRTLRAELPAALTRMRCDDVAATDIQVLQLVDGAQLRLGVIANAIGLALAHNTSSPCPQMWSCRECLDSPALDQQLGRRGEDVLTAVCMAVREGRTYH